MYNSFEVSRPRRTITSSAVRRSDEEIVESHLALSPSQMLEFAERGIPVSSQNLGVVYDEGYTDLEFEPPSHLRRGVDIGDLWESQQDVKVKFGSQLKKLRADGQLNPKKTE